MGRKTHTAEQIINKLREAEVLLSQATISNMTGFERTSLLVTGCRLLKLYTQLSCRQL